MCHFFTIILWKDDKILAVYLNVSKLMGPNPSVASPQYATSFGNPRTFDGYEPMSNSVPISLVKKVGRFGYSALWSARGIQSISPVQRVGHITVYNPSNDHAIIGYGVSSQNVLLADFWELDLSTCIWTKINIPEDSVSPRAGARAVMAGKYIWIYGGFANRTYISDLHVVDLETLAVHRPTTTGEAPQPCSGHAMTYSNGKIVVQGGFNGNQLSQLHILDLKTMHWTALSRNEAKYATGFTSYDGLTYIFGGSNVPGLLRIDPFEEIVSVVNVKGTAPFHGLTKCSLVTVDNYILCIGGEAPPSKDQESFFSPLYAFDTNTEEWFILHVSPDGVSTTFTDGEIDNQGVFRLPVCADASVVYRPKEREIVIFQGQPFKDPPVLIVISAGDSLGFLHLQSDMLKALQR